MVTIAPAPAVSGVLSSGPPIGGRAPDFEAPASPDGAKLKLSHYRGSPVVLVFYPGDFTPVCTSELGIFNELLPEFEAFGAEVFGLSCDSVSAHIAYAKELNVRIPLISDFHPKGQISKSYNVYRDDIGASERALVVIDGEGLISWACVSPIETNPGADGVLEALEGLTGKDLDAAISAGAPASDDAAT